MLADGRKNSDENAVPLTHGDLMSLRSILDNAYVKNGLWYDLPTGSPMSWTELVSQAPWLIPMYLKNTKSS